MSIILFHSSELEIGLTCNLEVVKYFFYFLFRSFFLPVEAQFPRVFMKL